MVAGPTMVVEKVHISPFFTVAPSATPSIVCSVWTPKVDVDGTDMLHLRSVSPIAYPMSFLM